jgi:hypothetical protein
MDFIWQLGKYKTREKINAFKKHLDVSRVFRVLYFTNFQMKSNSFFPVFSRPLNYTVLKAH